MIYTIACVVCTLFVFAPIIQAGEDTVQEQKEWQISMQRKYARQRERQSSQNGSSTTPRSNSTQSSYAARNKHDHYIDRPKWATVVNAQRIMVRGCACDNEHHANTPCKQGSSTKWLTYTAAENTRRFILLICSCPEKHNPTQPCSPRSKE